MAAIVKQTTVFIVVVLSVTHRLAEAGHVGHDRESAKIARYDQEKFGEHLDKDEGRDLSAKTRREVDTPVEKQPHFADFKRKTVNSMLWQTSRTQLEKEGLSLGTRLSTTGHLLNPESSGPHHIRTERDTTFLETQQKIRPKREVIIHPQLKPEVVMQVRIEMPMQKDTEEKYQEKLAQEKIPYLIDSRGNPLLFRPARTTPNPFIRQTNIEDYEIVKPNLGDQFRPISDADASDMESSYELSKEERDMSKYITDHIRTNFEKCPQLQHFPKNILKTVAKLYQSIRCNNIKIKLGKEEAHHDVTTPIMPVMNGLDWNKISSVEQKLEESLQMRLKRSVTRKRRKRKPRHKEVGKTLHRKRAKKRKQKQRRVERKRLRMLTHARRIRKQKKSKHARLERHYARMNMTTLIPAQFTNRSGENSTVMKDEDVEKKETCSTEQEKPEENYSGKTYEDDNNGNNSKQTEDYSDQSSTDNGDDDDYADSDYDDDDDDDDYNSDYESVEYENVENKPYRSESKIKEIKIKQRRRIDHKVLECATPQKT